MRNYFKYPPLKWRKRDEYCVPQGPSFRWASSVKVLIGGSKLQFKAPKHSPMRFGIAQYNPLRGHDVLNGGFDSYSEGAMANDHWGVSTPFIRRWGFWGPWMTGCKAELSMSVSVVGRHDRHEFKDISFFHPRAFETVIMTYLNDYYGHERWGGRQDHIPRYYGPVEWQGHRLLPVFSASFKVYNHGEDDWGNTYRSNPDDLFVFPITDRHFVKVRFKQHLYSRDKDHEAAFDTTPIQNLQNAIFNSFSLELSSIANMRYGQVGAECGHLSLSKEFAPLKWPTEARTPGEPVPESVKTEQKALGSGF